MKPNLFIVGAPKCGTTAWAQYLGSHPKICFSTVKEPSFFSTDFHKWAKVHSLEEYLSLFSHCGGEEVVAEASVRYLSSEVAAKNIRRFNPDASILIFVRRQEEYLPSLHNQALKNDIEDVEDFEQAWRLSGSRDESRMPSRCPHPLFLDYRSAGRFSEQVERFLAEFPSERIRIIHYDDWRADPRKTYLEILAFLGVGDDGRTDFPPVNVARHHKSRLIQRIVQSPPAWLMLPFTLIKKVTGKQRLRWSDRLLALNLARGYKSDKPSAELLEEIRAYYQADNERLRKLTSERTRQDSNSAA